ncbi:MAG: aldo/keto reductase [Asgard group archaeon]|nr:aldo/keto reductase [Asgard group archaeon]
MKKVRLGRTNLKVSRVGIGGIPLQRPSEKKAIEVVQHAVDSGINIIDTSIGYGTSEKRIGKALIGRRENVILITRTGATYKDQAKKNLEQSLKNLQSDFIDIYQLHGVSTLEDYNKTTGENGALEALIEAKEQGKIKYIGITSHCLTTIQTAVKSEIFDVILFPLNFVNTEAAEELVPLTKKLDIGFTAMKPFAGGRLSDVQLVMKYLMQFDNVVPVPGVETKQEIDEIIEIVSGSWEITTEEAQKMEDKRKELGKPFCQWCGYCIPVCPQKISIPWVINADVMWKLWPKKRLKERYRNVMKTANSCIECGDCENECPYHLSIRELLKESRQFIENKILV